jgi:hypothetical protein
MMRREFGGHLPASDFGVTSMVLTIVTLMISGGRRLQHLMYFEGDPLVMRLCGLSRLPTPRSVGRWLSELRVRHLPRLQRINAWVAAYGIRAAGLRRLTIDVDGSVVSTGQKVQWARRGFNPHRRKVPSYYPISAYEAQSGKVLRVHNRPGNVHDGRACLQFLRDLLTQIAVTLGGGRQLEFRMDGAFFRADVIDLLERQRVEYAIKVPFYFWLGLKKKVQQTTAWQRIDDTLSAAEHEVEVACWGRSSRIVIYRKRVQHQTAKNFQLDLFDPNDGHYEYSAITTNKSLGPSALWAFMCGRGIHEKIYGELKSGFAFDCMPSMSYAANSAWMILSGLAFNLMRTLQLATMPSRRHPGRKRRAVFVFETIHTLRYLYLHRAGVVCRPNGRHTLDVGQCAAVADRFKRMDKLLEAA